MEHHELETSDFPAVTSDELEDIVMSPSDFALDDGARTSVGLVEGSTQTPVVECVDQAVQTALTWTNTYNAHTIGQRVRVLHTIKRMHPETSVDSSIWDQWTPSKRRRSMSGTTTTSSCADMEKPDTEDGNDDGVLSDEPQQTHEWDEPKKEAEKDEDDDDEGDDEKVVLDESNSFSSHYM